jgi:hypothetical protein
MLIPASALAQSESGSAQDLRSPDARDAGLTAITQDLRSPDARDAAAGYHPTPVPGTVPTPHAAPAAETPTAGFD